MSPKTIFFDLDGTLTDSAEGIINCVILALEHFSLPVPDRKALEVFVGPPLREMFPKFGVPVDRVEEAIRVYRSRYFTVGKYENRPYDGIREMLETLKAHGHRMYIATSKPEALSQDILRKFDLEKYFDLVCGATLDGARDSKESVIAYLLEQTGGADGVVMVGDTHFDVVGAAAHGIPTIGVTWGYGDEKMMRQAGAIAMVNTTEELLAALER